MAITELVLPPLKNTEEAHVAFFEKIPAVMRANFRVANGPLTASLARVLESTPSDADHHRGVMAVITWESFDRVKAFLATPGFAEFKQTLASYTEGAPDLQFFDVSSPVAPEKTVQDATHFFVIKASGGDEEVGLAKMQWGRVTSAMSAVAGDQVKYHGGDGRQNVQGQFAGFSGWTSLEALKDALDSVTVKEQLRAMRESGASISSFTLELQHVF